jgi:flagellar basal body-associated protein FliL
VAVATEAEEPAAGEEPATEAEEQEESGIQDVLFTSFIIQ